MIQTRNKANNSQIKLIVPVELVKEKILSQLRKGEIYINLNIKTEDDLDRAWEEYMKWDIENRQILSDSFDSMQIVEEYSLTKGAYVADANLAEKTENYKENIKTRIAHLRKISDKLSSFDNTDTNQEIIKEVGRVPVDKINIKKEHKPSAKVRKTKTTSKELYMISDEGTENIFEVENYLKDLDINYNFLSVDNEKFELSENGYAVVFLNAKEIGGSATEKLDFTFRAQQNLIFRLGYLIGKLGREKVTVLYTVGIELPKEIEGLSFIPVSQSEVWKILLAKELKKAGFSVDMNKIIN